MCWLHIKKAALWLALRRPPPANQDVFADAPLNTDHFFIYFHDKEGQRRFIVRSMDRDGVTGLWFDDPRGKAQERTLTNAELRDLKPSFLHIYKKARFTYRSPFSLVWALATCYPARAVWRDKVLQRRFNRHELIRADRLRLLQHFLKLTIAKGEYRASVVSVMADLYTMRSMEHPRYQETESYYEWVLNSLVVSGEMARDGAYYLITDKAIPTIEHMEEQKDRHEDNITQQRRIGWLTVALISVALLQAGITVWQELHADPLPTSTESSKP